MRCNAFVQDAFPARIKNFLIVNEPSFIDGVIALFTQFMTAKLVSRVSQLVHHQPMSLQ